MASRLKFTWLLQLLAGEENFLVTLKESGANFTFDFSQVYWNSRLQTEHQRMIDFVLAMDAKAPAVVADMMAGIGPFAVPIAMGACQVHANGTRLSNAD